jgi:sugar lactone lactonase YvrE
LGTKSLRIARVGLLTLAAILFAIVAFYLLRARRTVKTYPPLSKIDTLTANQTQLAVFSDPFGIAAAPNGDVFVSDGDTGKIWRISQNGETKIVAENLATPSSIAIAPDGALIVAETGAHRIARVDAASGRVETIAGAAGRSGFTDGKRESALFNAPIGLAVARDGAIYVADTYNDRIRAIDAQGAVRTIAGGEEGFADGRGNAARFDTPCGIAVLPDGSLVVADTGNNRLRRVTLDGAVTTLAGNGEAFEQDGESMNASFDEPTGAAIDEQGTLYVADADGNALRVIKFGAVEDAKDENRRDSKDEDRNAAKDERRSGASGVLNFNSAQVTTLARGGGLADGDFALARLMRPSGIAVAPDSTLVVADAGNGLVRAVVGAEREHGAALDAAQARNLKTTDTEKFRAAAPPRWCYDPPQQPRELAATFGEVRGFVEDGKEAHFHNGLDVPGALGETVRAVRSETILRPIAVAGVGTPRERIRFPTLGYIHVRIGRDANEKNLNAERFTLRRDERGRVTGVRVRRGEQFAAGDAIGTLNTQYHCHLIAGRAGAEVNALAALELPGVRDTVAPTIEDVQFFDRNWQPFTRSAASKKSGTNLSAPITVSGDVRVVVRAYDQMNDNQARRRLGAYRLGYQILRADKTPLGNFSQPQMTISFERLPKDGDDAVRLVYAPHSQAGYGPQTIFAYIVTNVARDGEAREDFWRTADVAPGDYIVRAVAEDFFGNRTTRDINVRVAANLAANAK